jgi:TRAP-type C4-dicarboxylate transport system substrate-binding protein
MNKDKYDGLSAAQKKAIDDNCTNEAALKFAADWADFEYGGHAKLAALPDHEIYKLTPEQVAEWKKAAEPLTTAWADGVKKAGLDPTAVMNELKDALAKYSAGF